MEYINKEALRILKLFVNDDITSVKATVGAERKYFLVPKEIYYKRKDLIYTGRTLFSDKAPKGQELDHYFGDNQAQSSSLHCAWYKDII